MGSKDEFDLLLEEDIPWMEPEDSREPKEPHGSLQTGGAEGADLHFARAAMGAGHEVKIMSFQGHRPKCPQGSSLVVLSRQELQAAVPSLRKAAQRLGRALGSSPYVQDLLRRNFFQARGAQALYAVGEFEAPCEVARRSVSVSGGTAWACQLFADRILEARLPSTRPLPLYFFSQAKGGWFQCRPTPGGLLSWETIPGGRPPRPVGIYAGIGTRTISLAGQGAIEDLYRQTH